MVAGCCSIDGMGQTKAAVAPRSGLDLGPRSYSKFTCAPNSIFRWKKISHTLFVNNVTDKGLVSKIHK